MTVDASPEGRGLALRLRSGLHALFVAASVARLEDDAAAGIVVRRDRWLGLLLVRESAWRAGRRHGPEAARFPRGDVFRRRDFEEGVLHGTVREWHVNGVKALECRYERGVLHGKTSAWRRDGTKRFVGEYRSGAKTGEWFYLTRDGSLDRKRTGLYLDGLRLSGIKGFNEWLGSP